MFELTITITKKEWMSHPEQRWDAGLKKAGFNFRQSLSRSRYPPVPEGSRYIRTYMTADKANFNIVEPGKVMEFGSTHYLPYLLFDGTKHSALWPGKKEEMIKTMKQGFISGVKEFKDAG